MPDQANKPPERLPDKVQGYLAYAKMLTTLQHEISDEMMNPGISQKTRESISDVSRHLDFACMHMWGAINQECKAIKEKKA